MTTLVIILVLYLAGMLYVGYRGKKYSSNMGDFLTAAKQGTLIMVAGSFMGSHIGNGVVVGGAENGFTYGIGGMWFGIGASMSYILFGLIMAKKVYKGGYITISDLLKERYGDNATSTIFAGLNICASIGIMAGQIMAGHRLFQYIGLDPLVGAVTITLIVFIYASMSGNWGVMMTDVIQVTVIISTTVIALIYIAASGGFSLMATSLPAESFKLIPFDSNTFVMMLVPSALYGLISAASFQRTASSKNSKVANYSPMVGGLLLIPFVILPVLLGMYGKAVFPDAAAGTIIFKVLLEKLHPVLSGLMISAILAAVMSTVDSSLLCVTANVTNDLYKRLINPHADEKYLAKLTVAATVVVGLMTLIMSLQFKNLISLLSSTYSFLTAGGLVMVMGAIFWKKGTSKGAIASSAVGMLFVALNKFGGVALPYASIFPILPSLIAYVAVSLATQPKVLANK